MSAGRRGLLLSLAFLGLALWLCPAKRASAQPGRTQPGIRPADPGAGQHRIWKNELDPNQVREFLAKFGKGDPDAEDMFEKLLHQAIREKNPKATPEQIDALSKRLMADKEFRDRVIDLTQKHKNQNANNGGGDGPAPKLSPEDIVKLVKLKEGMKGGDPFKVPEGVLPKNFDPNKLPEFDPKNPNFDPKRFPFIDPNNPPKFDPDTKFPIDRDTGKQFDPRDGKFIDPQNPPRIEPKNPPKFNPNDPAQPPKIEPPKPPEIDPKTGRPVEQPNPDGKRKFDPENPLGTPPEPPDKAAKTKAVETATALWEKNVGPIEESPAVKRALLDLVNDPDAMDALTDDKGRNFFEIFEKDSGNGEKFGDWFGNGGDKWEWPKFDFNWGRGRDDIDIGSRRNRDIDIGSRDISRSRGSGSLDGMGSFSVGSMQVPVLLLLIILALIVGLVVWWKWGSMFPQKQTAAVTTEGGGGWPIDPREINTREDVVKAFEYLSVMICGPGAKTWTHSTIADELTVLAQSDPDVALKLARLYELARYAPLDEPLTRAELLEARRLVCDLAGMDEV